MDESILNTIKNLLGISVEITDFDLSLVMYINTVFSILYQLGAGDEAFAITDSTATWDEYLKDYNNLELVKNYIAAKVRLMFDPPTSSAVNEAVKNTINELEWRINIIVDSGKAW